MLKIFILLQSALDNAKMVKTHLNPLVPENLYQYTERNI